jgi:hypothetical protein
VGACSERVRVRDGQGLVAEGGGAREVVAKTANVGIDARATCESRIRKFWSCAITANLVAPHPIPATRCAVHCNSALCVATTQRGAGMG